jgi:hypothetical protein
MQSNRLVHEHCCRYCEQEPPDAGFTDVTRKVAISDAPALALAPGLPGLEGLPAPLGLPLTVPVTSTRFPTCCFRSSLPVKRYCRAVPVVPAGAAPGSDFGAPPGDAAALPALPAGAMLVSTKPPAAAPAAPGEPLGLAA